MSIEPAFGYEEAAAKLQAAGYDVSAWFLREHIKEVPHTKVARKVRFTDTQLAEYIESLKHKPAAPAPLKPVSRRRTA